LRKAHGIATLQEEVNERLETVKSYFAPDHVGRYFSQV